MLVILINLLLLAAVVLVVVLSAAALVGTVPQVMARWRAGQPLTAPGAALATQRARTRPAPAEVVGGRHGR